MFDSKKNKEFQCHAPFNCKNKCDDTFKYNVYMQCLGWNVKHLNSKKEEIFADGAWMRVQSGFYFMMIKTYDDYHNKFRYHVHRCE